MFLPEDSQKTQYTDSNELLKSFDQFVEDQSCEAHENLLANFSAFERVIEKAYSSNGQILTVFLQKLSANFKCLAHGQNSRLARISKEVADQASK